MSTTDPLPPNKVEFLVVTLGGTRCAVETGHVAKITACPAVTRIPRTPHIVEGVATIGGEVVIVLDLSETFGGVAGDDFLQFESDGRAVGIRIDRAAGIQRCPVEALSALDDAHAEVFKGDAHWFKAIAELEGERTPVLDRERIVAAARSR